MIQVLKTLDQRKRAEQSVELSRAEKLSKLSRASRACRQRIAGTSARKKRPESLPVETPETQDGAQGEIPYAAACDMSPHDFLMRQRATCRRPTSSARSLVHAAVASTSSPRQQRARALGRPAQRPAASRVAPPAPRKRG